MQISPSFSLTHLILAAALAKLGEIDMAKATAARVLQLQPDFRLGRHFAGADYAPELATSLTEALRATAAIAPKSLERFKRRIRDITRRAKGVGWLLATHV